MLQHGQTPLAGVTPVVRIRDGGGKVVKSFTATPTGKTGVYHAVVSSPSEGTYSYEVYDGFTSTAAPRRTRSSRCRSAPGETRSRICRSGSPLALALGLAGAADRLRCGAAAEPATVTDLREAA